MAATGEAVTYRELEARSNRLAHLLRKLGLKRLDHYAIFMENNSRYLEACGAGERSGLYFTCVNSYLTPGELAYILNNSQSRVLITSMAKLDVAREALRECPNVELCIVADGPGESERIVGLAGGDRRPAEDADRRRNARHRDALFVGHHRPAEGHPAAAAGAAAGAATCRSSISCRSSGSYREGMIYLSPAPLYHSAPQAAVNLTIREGGTAIIMEHFDPERYLELVEKWGVTHSQLVPTMFSRMLKLPEEVANALRPVVAGNRDPRRGALSRRGQGGDDRMVGADHPRILRRHRRPRLHRLRQRSNGWPIAARVGKVLLGDLHILDEDMKPCRKGTPGTVWFKTATPFEYFNDPNKTREARSPDGSMSTVGDVGYVDDDGYLHLTDRATFMIISGGVNIYPQECENLLITHPKVADAAVFGVPNDDLGEEVKAVVQPMPGVEPAPALAEELIAFCSQSLSRQKVPRSIDFEDELPRLPTGKLYKRLLRDRYWGNKNRGSCERASADTGASASGIGIPRAGIPPAGSPSPRYFHCPGGNYVRLQLFARHHRPVQREIKKMREAVIVSYARTGLAKSGRGGFNITPTMSMAAHAVKHAVERAGVEKERSRTASWATCAHGAGNIGRQAALLAGLPITTGGVTINRFCSSGLQSIAMAAQLRSLDDGADCIVAGGVESIRFPGGGAGRDNDRPAS